MKHFYLFLIAAFIGCFSHVSAQEKHFVFIQAENNQAFYVTLGSKNYSSTASGYVIIPKLSEGNYSIAIGFARDVFPEQGFQFSVTNKDLGFSLKNFGDKGWALFNLQTMATIQGKPTALANATKEKEKPVVEPQITFGPKKTEPVNSDSSIRAKEVIVEKSSNTGYGKENVVVKTEKEMAGENSKTTNKEIEKVDGIEEKKIELKDKSILKKENELKGTNERAIGKIEKVNELKGNEGVLLTYVDGQFKKPDTIQLVITANKNDVITETSTAENSVSKVETAPADKTASGENKFLPIVIDPLKGEQPNENLLKSGDGLVNSNCKEMASEDDYTRVRRKMAQENTDEKMIAEAKKFYRNKCFTTNQLKSLSTLFLSDEGRYKFFDASYEFVYDPQKYTELQSEFIDPSFAERFRTILKN